MPEKILRLNQRQVIHETFDDEIVIVNLDTGSYYSLTQIGAAIWQQLARGASAAQLQAFIASQYAGDNAEMERAVQKFLDELIEEKLVESGEDAPPASSEIKSDVPLAPFQAPILNKYTDMEELLLLDPIHEVDDLGWPSAKTDSPA